MTLDDGPQEWQVIHSGRKTYGYKVVFFRFHSIKTIKKSSQSVANNMCTMHIYNKYCCVRYCFVVCFVCGFILLCWFSVFVVCIVCVCVCACVCVCMHGHAGILLLLLLCICMLF